MKKILLVCTLAVLTACSKEITELPEATQTGAHTFGARVNGELWGPQGFGIAPSAPLLEAKYYFDQTSYLINVRNFSKQPTETEMEIFLMGVNGPGTYYLNTTTTRNPGNRVSYAHYVERKLNPVNEWITSAQHTGSVTITKADTVNRILSGTFEFRAGTILGTAEPLNVTEGRFDIKL